MNILLYGGTFNPPHIGHVAAAKTAWEILAPDKLIWMPAGDPPHKALPPGTPGAAHRLEMSRLALLNFPEAELSDLEIRSKGLRYTFDTAGAILARAPGARLTILTGGDMLMSLDSWHRAPELLARYAIAAITRGGGYTKALEEKAMELIRGFGARISILPHIPVEISSTALRSMLRRKEGREYLAEPVWNYIRENGLYLKDIVVARK